MGGNGARLPVIGALADGWSVHRFAELLDGGTRNGVYKSKEFHGRGVKIVNMGELFAHPRLADVPMKRVQLSADELKKSALAVGDLLFARRSLVAEGAGKCSVVCAVNEATTFESSIIRARPDSAKADSLFLYYLFSSPYGTYILDTIRRQVAVAGITGSDLVELPIPVPPIAEQKAIATTLGALDEKIELNRRMNANLETIARALFQSWFVDFDPVRAKVDGRQPAGLDPATASLFSNEFEDSELGPIPRGSRVGKVEDILTFNRSAVDPSEFRDELFAHYSLPAFDEGRVPKLELGDAIKSHKLVVPTNVVLLSKLNPHIPRIWLPDITSAYRAVCSTEFLVAQPKSGISREFLFCLFTSGPFTSEYATLVTGTTGSHQRVRSESVLQMKITIPPEQIIDRFSTLANVTFGRISRNIRESATLAALRDALLPKLLSGELSVSTINLEGAAWGT